VTAYNDNPQAIGDYVWINADDTAGRRSRAAQINAARKAYQAEHGVTLTLIAQSYSETPGFLARSAFRYRINRA
jgi:hypothetical protein